MTDAQKDTVSSYQTLHKGVRFSHVRHHPHHEGMPEEKPPVLIQWRYRGAIRSRMVFADGDTGPIGESAVYV